MSAFELTRRTGFVARIRAFLGERVQRPVADADLDRLCARGQAYGLVSEQELAGYVVMAWAVEAWRAPQDPEWIVRIMGDPHRVAPTPSDAEVEDVFEQHREARAANWPASK